MQFRMPADGDVVIEALGPAPTRHYALRVTPGPAQVTFRSPSEATRIAVAFAAHARVEVWLREGTSADRMVASFREPAAGRPSDPLAGHGAATATTVGGGERVRDR